MFQINLAEGIVLERTADYIHVHFDRPSSVISSAMLNGGTTKASHILNLNVGSQTKNLHRGGQLSELTLTNYIKDFGWEGTIVGMMTTASMNSFRLVEAADQGVEIFALVTAGLSNARCAGDPAEHREIGSTTIDAGTINLICLTTAELTPAAMIEAVIIATEAKTAALLRLGIKSRVSENPATGTGTDAIAIASGHGTTKVKYCGKHVLFGEILANLVIEAICASINRN